MTMKYMTKDEVIAEVKSSLNITDTSRDVQIGDFYDAAVVYTHQPELPAQLLGFIRRKTKAVIDYEAAGGPEFGKIASQTEGKCSWTYDVASAPSGSDIYGLSALDYNTLVAFRKVRW